MTTLTSRPAWRSTFALGRRARRVTLVAHIVGSGGWIGMDLVLAVLCLRAWLADDPEERAVAMQAVELFGVVPMTALALLSLVTGVLLGLGTKYGLVRYWWVAVKLVLNVVFCLLLVLSLRPGLHDVAARGRALAAGDLGVTLPADMAFPLVVSLSGLLFATVLSVVKPWGRIRATANGRAGGDL